MLNRQIDKDKKTVLLVFLLSSVVAATVFAILNVNRNQYLLAGLEFFIAIFSLVLLIYMHFKKEEMNLEILSLLYVLLFCSVLIYAFSSDKSSDSIFIWALVIPMISYLLLGVKLGFIVTAVYYSIAAWFFLARFSGHPMMSENVSYANVIFSTSLFWILSHAYEYTNHKSKNKLRKMAVLDHLTNLYNRILLERIYQDMQDEAAENGETVGLLLLDLDHFKKINDEFGHATGDQVLIEFSNIIRAEIKSQGEAFRVGGEEFLILLRLSNESTAIEMAESIRMKTEQLRLKKMRSNGVTVSVGVSVNAHHLTIEEMIRTADRKMYQAKQQGRNRIVQ